MVLGVGNLGGERGKKLNYRIKKAMGGEDRKPGSKRGGGGPHTLDMEKEKGKKKLDHCLDVLLQAKQ